MGAARLGGMLLGGVALALGGCADTVQTRAYPRLAEGIEPIEKVAVAPFALAGELAEPERSDGLGPAARRAESPEEASALVARYFAEALHERGVEVIPADDLVRSLEVAGADSERFIPRQVARVAHAKFGVDAIVLGSVSRFKDRRGGSGGTTEPASVWFDVALYSAPGAEKLWTGTFRETQKPFTENVLTTAQYPGGGTRWLSAEELARWGAEQTARAMPLGQTLTPEQRR
jgi:hypothetical protein